MKAAPLLIASDALPAAPRQARSIERQRRILDAARELFAEKGYEATSIDDITTAAEAAAGAFYTYFRSKRQLLIVMMNELLQRLAAVDLRPDTGLRDFLGRIFETDLQYFGVIRAWQEASLTDASLAAMREEIESWTQKRIVRVFQLLQKRPGARPDRDLQTFARMLDRHFWSLLARGATLTPRALQRELAVAADVIEHYLSRDHTP